MNNRNNIIDVIRGFAIISVILLHINIRIPFAESFIGGFLPDRLINILFRSGYYGVIIFFVISGFLITSSSLNRFGQLSNVNIGRFYQIRFARIIPCLIAFIALSSALHLLNVKGFVITTTTLFETIFSALTFHLNWLEAKTGYLNGAWDVLWSLSIEEIFYFFFPLICLFVRKACPDTLKAGDFIFILILLIFILLGPFARCAFIDNDIWSDHSYLSCMDAISFGCLAAMYTNKIKINKKLFLSFLITGLTLFIFIFFFRKATAQFGLTKLGLNVTLLEISMAFILITTQYLNGTNFIKNWFVTPFRWFGKNSYEIYLSHMFIVLSLVALFKNIAKNYQFITLFYGIILILSGLTGYLLATYFSEPLNKKLRSKIRINSSLNLTSFAKEKLDG